MASELHNNRIRDNQRREMVVVNMNDEDDDDEALLDNTTEDSVTCDEQVEAIKYMDIHIYIIMLYFILIE